MPRRPAHTFPFSAIVGQRTLKLALLLNAVDPRVGGVLIRGEKGTAKSTAVRSLAAVLPDLDVVADCRFSCDPGDPGSWCDECRERRDTGQLPKEKRASRVVELPVSATEDRLVGTLDFEQALKAGERAFHPGLLARAHRSILYVDEVNLLDDHLVDTLLDAAAMGVCTVEREGISFAHPSRFILVGTMNPEEGELRPQLLDRFGLCAEVSAVREPEERVEIMRRWQAFENDPEGFIRQWQAAEDELRTTIAHARLRLPLVKLPESAMYAIADLSLRAGVDGHRADNVMARAACALAALEDRQEAGLADVERVAYLVLAHRLRTRPFEDVATDADTLRASLMQALGTPDTSDAQGAPGESGPGEGQVSIFETYSLSGGDGATDGSSAGVDLQVDLDRTKRSMSGKRQQSITDDSRGRYRRAEPAGGTAVSGSDIALDATIRAAARRGRPSSETGESLAVTVETPDLHRKVRSRKVGASIVFCVDASGSMGAAKRMEAARAAVLELLREAYQRRDRVSLITFRGTDAQLVLAPTASVDLADLRLKAVQTGGATPLAHGINRALEVIDSERRREPDIVPWLVLLTDGRANVGLDGGLGSDDAKAAARRLRTAGVHSVVIDTASGPSAAARDIARAADAEYVRLDTVDGARLAQTVRQRLS